MMCLSWSPALHDIFHTPVARYRLFVLKVPLNTNQLTNDDHADDAYSFCLTGLFFHKVFQFRPGLPKANLWETVILIVKAVLVVRMHLFVQPRVPSFLSMDMDGRVLRLDSFSKTMGGG